MKLFLLRHGETEWNKCHRFQGRIDVPLNDFGRDLARVTRQRWPLVTFDKVYCSPLCRAVETAKIVLEDRPESDHSQFDERIIEFGFGISEGTDIDEAAANPENPMYNLLHHPESYVPARGGESFQQLIGRARSFLEEEVLPLEKQGVQNVLVVAHGAIIRGFVCAIGQKEIKDFWETRYLNCCLTTIDVTDGICNDHFGGWRR